MKPVLELTKQSCDKLETILNTCISRKQQVLQQTSSYRTISPRVEGTALPDPDESKSRDSATAKLLNRYGNMLSKAAEMSPRAPDVMENSLLGRLGMKELWTSSRNKSSTGIVADLVRQSNRDRPRAPSVDSTRPWTPGSDSSSISRAASPTNAIGSRTYRGSAKVMSLATKFGFTQQA